MTSKTLVREINKGKVKDLEEAIRDYGKNMAHTLLVLSGKSNCDSGWLIKKYKDLF